MPPLSILMDLSILLRYFLDHCGITLSPLGCLGIALSHSSISVGLQGQKHLQVIALGSEVWDPISIVVSTLYQAMLEGYWLVLDNCHLVPHWPRELIQLLLQLMDRAKGEYAA